MRACNCCGIEIPDGQRTCSMCYGDINHGSDGYYEQWALEQELKQLENKDMTELESILNKFEELKGQFVIYNGSVLRVIGVGKDTDDYYFILWDGYEFDTASIEERLIVLKNKLIDDDYNYFMQEAYNINKECVDETALSLFRKTLEDNLQNYYPTFEVVTDLYWDIN